MQEFQVKDSGWLWDKKSKGAWWFVLGKKQLSADMDWAGPPLKIKDAVVKFKKIYKKTFTRKGRVWTKIKRQERTPEQVLKRVLNEAYVKERVRSAR